MAGETTSLRYDAVKMHVQISHGQYTEGEPEVAPLLCVIIFKMEME